MSGTHADGRQRATAGGIDRRAFVGTAGIGLTALAGMGALACAAPLGEDSNSEEAPTSDAPADKASATAAGAAAPQVYFTCDISSAGLVRAFGALSVELAGSVAVKLSTGESGGTNFLQPELVADLVQRLGGTIVECATVYGGARSTAEAAKAVADYMDGNICYVNVMNRLSVDCDCDFHPVGPNIADIGILASLDPVALDRAAVDLVHAAEDGTSLVEHIESRNGAHTLAHAEAIVLGSQTHERAVELAQVSPTASRAMARSS